MPRFPWVALPWLEVCVSVLHESFNALAGRLADFDCIIDTRSPAEYAEDHLPGALNLPVLSDTERAEVGTLYRQRSPFEARKVGAALVARNIARHIETDLMGHPKDWRPLVYCWRGGERSASMAHILARIGWRTTQLAGGYKGYRRAVIEAVDALAPRLQYRVLCGPTGSGKSHLLRALAAEGAQVLDLEALALHRGSVLGTWPDARRQPSQRAFESALWLALANLRPGEPVYVEAESRKIGDLRVPISLAEALRSGVCVEVELEFAERVRLLLEDYAHLIAAPDELRTRLGYLTERHGRSVVAAWVDLVDAARWESLVSALLCMHYDPAYRRSLGQHFPAAGGAPRIAVARADEEGFRRAARALRASWSSSHRPEGVFG
jgi:tRNA 2-selenouridine synthase